MPLDLYDNEAGEFTRLEKVLALALVAFLLVGGSWILRVLGDIPSRPDWSQLESQYDLDEARGRIGSLQQELNAADRLLGDLEGRLADARVEYEFRREEYRTYLDRGEDDPERREAFEAARSRMEELESQVASAQSVVEERTQLVEEANREQRDLQAQVSSELRRLENRYELTAFLFRLAYALPLLLLAVLAWWRVRARRSPYLIIMTSVAGFAALQLIVLVFQYTWTLFRDAAQLIISIGGSAIAIGGIVALRRYLFNPARQARSRLRQGACPGCGFPLSSDPYCPGCGRQVRGDCPHCGQVCLSDADYCSACGRERE